MAWQLALVQEMRIDVCQGIVSSNNIGASLHQLTAKHNYAPSIVTIVGTILLSVLVALASSCQSGDCVINCNKIVVTGLFTSIVKEWEQVLLPLRTVNTQRNTAMLPPDTTGKQQHHSSLILSSGLQFYNCCVTNNVLAYCYLPGFRGML